MKLNPEEKNLSKCLKDRKRIIDKFILYPPIGDTIIQEENDRAVIISKGDHLEFNPIRESVYNYLYEKYI